MITLKRNSFITILSTRKSGKSYLVAQLIYNFLTNPESNKCDLLYMFSNTSKFEEGGNYDFIDKKCMFPADVETVEKVVGRLLQIQLKTNKKHHIMLVFDDIDLSKKYEGSLEKLATMGRHYNITTVLSAQVAVNAVSPAIRNNTTYLFFRKLNNEAIKKQVYSMIITDEFESPQEFHDFVKQNIGDYQFIFYDNDGDNKQLQVIKADPIPKDFKYIVKDKQKEPRKKVQFTTEIPLYNV